MNYIKTLFDLWSLKRNEKKTPDEISDLQNQKLRKLLHYAYENSEYYRDSFEKAGISADKIDSTSLSKFPTIDKSILLSQFDSIVTVPDLKQEEIRRFDENEKITRKPFNGKYHIVHSSGSTGKPGYSVYDKSAWNSMLLGIIRGALWNMSMSQILKFYRVPVSYISLPLTGAMAGLWPWGTESTVWAQSKSIWILTLRLMNG